MLALAVLPAAPVVSDPLTIFFVDPTYADYSGDAMVVQTPDGRCYIVDGGERDLPEWDCGRDRVAPLLDSLEVPALDGIVATHPHADHIGGLIYLLQHYPVDHVWDNGLEYSTYTYEQYVTAVAQSGAEYEVVRRGDFLDWGPSLTVEAVHPTDPLGQFSVNSTSIVLRVTYGNVSFLLAGDLETADGEASVLQALGQGDIETISAQVLKVGHQGSSDATSNTWLSNVAPVWAAICVGAGNPYGHPHWETLQRLYSYGVEIFRTDLDGTFYISTDGDSLYYNSLPGGGGPGGPQQAELSVYPNPATEVVTIAWPGETTRSLTIYNMLGETVHEASSVTSPYEWDLRLPGGGLASPGLYIAVTESGGGERRDRCFALSR